jgi:hypothetical protein
VLDQTAALEHGDLGHAGADLHRHEVPTDRFAVAFAPATLFERRRVEFGAVGLGLAAATAKLDVVTVVDVTVVDVTVVDAIVAGRRTACTGALSTASATLAAAGTSAALGAGRTAGRT